MNREQALHHYHMHRIEACAENLKRNNFEVIITESIADAEERFFDTLLPRARPRTVSWGDSLTLHASGILGRLGADPAVDLIEIEREDMSWDESIEQRRKALLADLFITGTNALTEAGQLVNLDMIGNRIAALLFGPRKVVVLAGRNKIVPHLTAAMDRCRNFAAPVNAARFGLDTPCVGTGFCADCARESRICNGWSITEKSYPASRIAVVLINEDLGF
ncbi:MAG: lactate utilization protein [Spirochaetia bacterium]